MAIVSSVDHEVQAFTGGLASFEVQAANVRGLIAALEARFPGLGSHVQERMALAIDGEIVQDGLSEPIGPQAEVVLIPRIGAG